MSPEQAAIYVVREGGQWRVIQCPEEAMRVGTRIHVRVYGCYPEGPCLTRTRTGWRVHFCHGAQPVVKTVEEALDLWRERQHQDRVRSDIAYQEEKIVAAKREIARLKGETDAD